MGQMITVSKLQVSPVKGLAMVLREQVRLEADGVAEDRRLFLMRADATVATIRRFPALLRVTPHLDLGAETLSVTFPDGRTVSGDLSSTGEDASSRLFGKDRRGRVVPGPVAEALSDYVGEPLRLVLADRIGVGWDEGPVSLLGEASASAVGTPTAAGLGSARYRMLIEVRGTEAYEEDTWAGRTVQVGQARILVTHALARCVVITYSPYDGSKDWAGLEVLADHRGRRQLNLGVIARVSAPGVVSVGDQLELSPG
jgi:hypothetical protein